MDPIHEKQPQNNPHMENVYSFVFVIRINRTVSILLLTHNYCASIESCFSGCFPFKCVKTGALTRAMKAYMYVELECLPMCSCEAEMAADDSQTGHTSFPFVSCHRCKPTLSCGNTALL